MPTKTISALGGNWNAAGTWDEGAVPQAGDDVVARGDGTSGNLIVNTGTAALGSINFTNYTRTLSGSSGLSVAGNITLVAGMTITMTGLLTISSTATITSNGKTWPSTLTLSNAVTITLADNWTVTGTLTVGNIAAGGTQTINGNAFNVNGSFNSGVTAITRIVTGTTVFNITGTGTWTGTGLLRNDVNINTAGTLTLVNSAAGIRYETGTITYITGTIVSTGNTLNLNSSATLNTNGMVWNEIGIAVTQTLTCTTVLRANTITISTTVNVTFSGAGFTVGTFDDTNNSTSNKTRTFSSTGVFTVTGSLLIYGLTGANKIYQSSSGTDQVVFTLQQGATHEVEYCSATRVNSSLGKTIFNRKGTHTTTTNWVLLVPNVSLGYTYIN